ncbi:MAG: hypothetical protein IPM92_09090 [Saprospiraceae bacterium]|nr:hypothetical protein [Saprospiraceae bacterium]
MILDSLGMAASAATLFYLRRNASSQDSSHIYAMRFYPFVPVLFIMAYLFVCVSCIYLYPQYGLIAAIVFIGLIGIYHLLKKRISNE